MKLEYSADAILEHSSRVLLINSAHVIFEHCADAHALLQENPACTKNNNRDKLLLTSLADTLENTRGRDRQNRGRGRGDGQGEENS